MIVLILWFALCFIVGSIGQYRSIGFKGAFAVSLLLTPLVGLFVTLLSEEIFDKATRAIMAGERLLEKKKYDSAISAFQSALKSRPYSIAVHYNLARAYSLKNMPKEALYHLNKAFERGYLNIHRVQNNPDLDNLRKYEGFKSFQPDFFLQGYFYPDIKGNELLAAS